MRRIWWAAASLLFGISFGVGHVAFADITLVNPLGQNSTFQSVLGNVMTFLVAIAAPICGILVVVGGFQMMTAAGNPEKFSTGRKTLLYAAIGFVVVLFASSVVPLITSILNGQ